MITAEIENDNYKVFAWLSDYLNNRSDLINKEAIEEIVKCGVSYEYAFAVIIAAAFGLDIVDNVADKDLFNRYFINMVHKLDATEYYDNPYYRNIKIPSIKMGNSELKYDQYKPFEVLSVMISFKRKREG